MDTKWLSTLLVAMVLAAAALASERELSFDGDDNSYAEGNRRFHCYRLLELTQRNSLQDMVPGFCLFMTLLE